MMTNRTLLLVGEVWAKYLDDNEMLFRY